MTMFGDHQRANCAGADHTAPPGSLALIMIDEVALLIVPLSANCSFASRVRKPIEMGGSDREFRFCSVRYLELDYSVLNSRTFQVFLMLNTHRRRDATVELSRVGGVYLGFSKFKTLVFSLSKIRV